MLVGTYQGVPIVSAKEENDIAEKILSKPESERTSNERNFVTTLPKGRAGRDRLGINPVWFFPMTTLADAFAHSALISTFAPLYFLVYDLPEDEMIKLDAVRHEMSQDKTLDYWRTDTDDLSIVEYVIDNRKLDNYKPKAFYPVFLVRDIGSSPLILGEGGVRHTKEMQACYYEFSEDVFRYFDDILLGKRPYHRLAVDLDNLNDPEAVRQISKAQVSKDEFTFAYLPFVYAMVQWDASLGKGLPINLATLLSISRDIDRFFDLRRQFITLSNSGSLNHDNYKRIYDQLKNMVCDDEEVLITLWEDGEPRRNDKCPCGSGKKWKHCHGRLHHKVRC